MPNLKRISEEIRAAQRPKRKIGGHIEAAGTGSAVGGRVGGEGGGSVGGGSIASASGITGAAAAQAMQKAGEGPAPDERRIARHQPKAAASTPTDYPTDWLVTTPTGQVV